MIECKICNTPHENVRKFSKHINFHHNVNLESYYSKFISLPTKCVICNTNDVRFVNYDQGYSDCCSSRSCSATHRRSNLKLNKAKFDLFTSKVSSNMKTLWKDTDTTERRVKASNSMHTTVSNMTDEERKIKFGWMNRLSNEDRSEFILNVMLNTGMHKWWKTASMDDKLSLYNKRSKTLSDTWDRCGSDIMAKQMATFLKNRDYVQSYEFLDESSYDIINSKLSLVFDL